MLDVLMHPRSVCVIGASSDPRKLAGRPLLRLTQHSFPGEIYLVNPKYDHIAGRRCYPSVSAIGQPVDVALILLPAAQVPKAIRECGAAGVRFAVVCSSGFAEDARAADLVHDLADAVESSGVRLVGPNCEGIWSVPASMALTFGSAADRRELLAGTVSVISQSGSIGGACMRQLQERGIGCRYFVSSGNEDDLTAMDYLEYMVDEGGSQVVAMFVEGLRAGHRLRQIARRAAQKQIRLIALCAGASELGRLATSSHTGRMASAGAVYRDLLAQCGVLQVDTFEQLVAAIEVACFGRLPGRSADVESSGVGIVAMSGGSRALLADSCERLAVPMARFTHATEAALDGMLPQFGFSKNPTDLTGQVLADPELFSRVLLNVVEDQHTEALIIQYANGAERQLTPQIPFFRDLISRTHKPVVISLLGAHNAQLMTDLRSAGVLCADDPHRAVQCVGWLYRWRGYADAAKLPPAPEIKTISRVAAASWDQRMSLMETAGLAVAPWTTWDGELENDAPDLRFPVALKALPDTAEHKSESGLVFVGLRDKQDLARAMDSFRDRVPDGTPALIQEMVTGPVEILLAARVDPDFGPILVLGSGGVLTEWLRDVTYVPLPATAAEIDAALRRLRVWRLLQPFRGRGECDIEALIDSARRLGETFLRHFTASDEIELNPLIVGLRGEGATVVDVLVSTVDGAV